MGLRELEQAAVRRGIANLPRRLWGQASEEWEIALYLREEEQEHKGDGGSGRGDEGWGAVRV